MRCSLLVVDEPGENTPLARRGCIKETLNKYGFVVPAKAGTQLIQQAGFPLLRE
jgi:hypothetical protein